MKGSHLVPPRLLPDEYLLRKLLARSVIVPLTDITRAKLKAAGITTRRQKPCLCMVKHLRPDGYARMRNGIASEYVHRMSYRIHKGLVPAGLDVLHHCDTTSCWEPSHLWTGTQGDNNRDCHAKGQTRGPSHQRGALHAKAKLTEAQARRIKQMATANPRRLPSNMTIGSINTRGGYRLNVASLARHMEVSESLVRGVISGRNWAWLI